MGGDSEDTADPRLNAAQPVESAPGSEAIVVDSRVVAI